MKNGRNTLIFYALASGLPLAAPLLPPLPLELGLLPWICLPLVAFLGFRLNQTRILFSAAIFLGLFYLLRRPQESAMLASLCLGLPLSLLAVFSFKESPLASTASLARLCAAFFAPLLLIGLSRHDPARFAALMAWRAFPDGGLGLPHAALVAWAVLLGSSLLWTDAKVRGFMPALCFSVLPAFAALNSGAILLAGVSVSVMLSWAVFQMYWQRVYMDELTGVPNRRALDERLAALTGTYAIAMVDIDHFKKFNDSYGHDEGDNVLRLVAAHLNEGSGGLAYRYGGEEFCLVFEGWDTEKAGVLSDTIREKLGARKFTLRSKKKATVQVTISMGVAAPDKDHPRPEDVIKLADKGLYKAKEAGRNQVIRQN